MCRSCFVRRLRSAWRRVPCFPQRNDPFASPLPFTSAVPRHRMAANSRRKNMILMSCSSHFCLQIIRLHSHKKTTTTTDVRGCSRGFQRSIPVVHDLLLPMNVSRRSGAVWDDQRDHEQYNNHCWTSFLLLQQNSFFETSTRILRVTTISV